MHSILTSPGQTFHSKKKCGAVYATFTKLKENDTDKAIFSLAKAQEKQEQIPLFFACLKN